MFFQGASACPVLAKKSCSYKGASACPVLAKKGCPHKGGAGCPALGNTKCPVLAEGKGCSYILKLAKCPLVAKSKGCPFLAKECPFPAGKYGRRTSKGCPALGDTRCPVLAKAKDCSYIMKLKDCPAAASSGGCPFLADKCPKRAGGCPYKKVCQNMIETETIINAFWPNSHC